MLRRQLPPYALPYAIHTANGLDATAIADGENRNDRFLYASTPTAGLLLLLTMWPQVQHRMMPTRTRASPRSRLIAHDCS